MSDAINQSRLPDLPNAGYASPSEKSTSDLVMFFLRGVERNRPLLLSIVVDGVQKWRKTAGKAWDLNRAGRSTAITTELLDNIFRYMVMLAGPNPAEQLLILHGQMQQAQRAKWDHRKATAPAMRAALRASLADLRRERKRKPH